MQQRETAILTRDCPAVLIPAGDDITLKQGQLVTITQDLGGSYTVIVLGNMARIDGQDADALGKVAVAPEEQPVSVGSVNEEAVWEQLRTCYDPEIPVNVVDLGLIYDLVIDPPDGNNGSRVAIKMTLTAPGCGMGDIIARDVQNKVQSLPGVSEANVELVWEPLWNQSMMSEAARLKLGFL